MANATHVTVEAAWLAKAVHEMVKANIDDNIEAADGSMARAADTAVSYLSVHAADGMRLKGKAVGGSERTEKSLSQYAGLYRSGWRNYHYRGIFNNPDKYKSVLCIVANHHVPTLTHLFENGFYDRGGKKHKGKWHAGNKQIKKAYDRAAPIVRGGVS